MTFYHEWSNKTKSLKSYIANNNILKEETVLNYQTINNRVSTTQLNVKIKVNDNSKDEIDDWSKNKDENECESEGKNDDGKENKIDFARESETEESWAFKVGDMKKDNIDNVIVKVSTTKDDEYSYLFNYTPVIVSCKERFEERLFISRWNDSEEWSFRIVYWKKVTFRKNERH